MEVEYVSLSMTMKDLLSLKRIFRDVYIGLNLGKDITSSIKSIIWEDNAGVSTLAKLPLPRVTPRSKHFAVKYHWFREYVQDPKEQTELHKIDTKIQLADLLTKSLSKLQFQLPRKRLTGW